MWGYTAACDFTDSPEEIGAFRRVILDATGMGGSLYQFNQDLVAAPKPRRPGWIIPRVDGLSAQLESLRGRQFP